MVDVAAHAGVSLGTVSNVLNRPDRVAPATRARVLKAIEELGFVRNEAARQLRAGRSRTIGLVVLDVGNPFFTDIAAGVEQAAEDAGLSVVLCNSNQDRARELRHLSSFQEQRVFGVLITPVGPASRRIQRLREGGTSVVLVDRASGRHHCSVSVDDQVGGAVAIEHLLALGHRRIAFVGGPTSLRQVSERLDGARAALEDAGGGARLTVLETAAMTVACGREAGAQLARTAARTRSTAVFCANDLLALGVLQEMTRKELRVPQDMAIVGYDDIDFAAAAAVPLTSVRQPRAQLGRSAAELLIDEVRNPNSHDHRQLVFEPELVMRESTGRPDRESRPSATAQ